MFPLTWRIIKVNKITIYYRYYKRDLATSFIKCSNFDYFCARVHTKILLPIYFVANIISDHVDDEIFIGYLSSLFYLEIIII